jgi:L-iditol 2-dehydrogenase
VKALKYLAPWDVALQDVPDLHAIGPDDVVVDVKFCGICGTDLGIVSGSYPVAVPGVTLGHEASGVIAEIGSAVDTVAVGDRVVINPTPYCGVCRMCRTGRINHCVNKDGTESGVSYDGAYATRYRTTSGFVHRLPDHIPLGLLYAWALWLKGLTPVVVERSAARVEFANTCLPEGVRAYASLEEARVKGFNEVDAPLDVVVDTTSVLLEEIYPQLAHGGTFMSIGLKEKNFTIDGMHLADRSLSVIGSIDSLHGSFVEAFHLITSGRIPAERLVSHVVPLSSFQTGFAALGCDIPGRAMTPIDEGSCKVLIEIDR